MKIQEKKNIYEKIENTYTPDVVVEGKNFFAKVVGDLLTTEISSDGIEVGTTDHWCEMTDRDMGRYFMFNKKSDFVKCIWGIFAQKPVNPIITPVEAEDGTTYYEFSWLSLDKCSRNGIVDESEVRGERHFIHRAKVLVYKAKRTTFPFVA